MTATRRWHGIAAAAAHARGAEANGVDVSLGMIELACKRYPGIGLQVGEVTALPFSDTTVNTVICNFALDHFPEPDAALAECVRILTPGGILAFS